MITSRVCLFVLLAWVPLWMSAQTINTNTTQKHTYVLKGKVTDASTGEGVSFAILDFPGGNIGTVADSNGIFEFTTDQLPGDSIRVQALSYKTMRVFVDKKNTLQNLDIELKPSENTINETEIFAGEDPAVLLIRKVIEKKPINNPDKLASYSYEAYNRMEADMQNVTKDDFAHMPIFKSYTFIFNGMDTTSETEPFLPLYMTEAISDYYFRSKPRKQRELIKASRITGVTNPNVDKYLGAMHESINMYWNYIPVLDKKFIGPLNNDALFYYKYKITDSGVCDGYKTTKLHFEPRRKGENCFTGDIWIVDSVYALQKADIVVSDYANINWIDKARITQEFAPIDSFWFYKQDGFSASFSAYRSRTMPALIGRKTTTYHNIKLNDSSIAAVLNNPAYGEEVTKLDSARLHNNLWWAKNRPDSLTTDEKTINRNVDSINAMPITTKYKNLIFFLASGVKDVGPIEFGPYFYLFSSNTVEGDRFRLSLATPRKLKNIHITGFLAYGTLDERYKYGFTGTWMIGRHPWSYIYAYDIHDIDQSANYYDQIGSDNIFSAIARKPGIPWKLAFSDEQRIEYFKEYFSGFSHKLILQNRAYTPYAPLPSQGIFVDDKGNPTSTAKSFDAALELRYAYKDKYIEGLYTRSEIATKYPVWDLQLTNGFKNVFNSAYAYQSTRFAVSQDVNIPPLGHIFWNVFSGKYFGTLPYPLLEIHPGNEYYYYNPNAFEMMNTYEFISDQYAGLILEHTLGSGMFNYIPGLKKMKLRQFWTAKGVIGSLSDANEQLNLNKGYAFRTLQGNPYLELGTGISNIFHLFRIDFDWRVAPAPLPSESRTRYFGVFGSMVLQF